jgi:drug/metabolite transporter (DMT)-like permease
MNVRPGLTASSKGIAVMVLGTALLTGNDAASKYLTENYPLGQVICLRQAAALLAMLPYIVWVSGWGPLRVHAWGRQLARGLLFTVSAGLMVTGLSLLPIATVIAITFAGPIFVALLSVPMLGERVNATRWIAIAMGFAGVLIAVRPTSAAFEWVLLIPLATALTSGIRDIVTRQLSRTDTSISILLVSTSVVMFASLATAPFGWKFVTWVDAGWFFVAGVLHAGANFLMIEAFRLGAAALIAPFRYTALLWALLIGFAVWGDTPDPWIVAGGAVIIAGGILMLRSEAPTSRAAGHPERGAAG